MLAESEVRLLAGNIVDHDDDDDGALRRVHYGMYPTRDEMSDVGTLDAFLKNT